MKTKWLKATEYYGTGTDPLRGKRRALSARHVTDVSAHIRGLVPTNEIAAAIGGDAKAQDIASGRTQKHAVMRVRADYIAFLKALAARHEANTGKTISLPNVASAVAVHGMRGVVALPEFRQVGS